MFTADATARRPARQPHRRDRRPPADPVLLAGQRRGRPAHRADHRRARRRPGLQLPVPQRRPGHGRRADGRRRRLRPPRRAAATHPVRLRRQRHHPGDVDAAHLVATRASDRRDHLRPLRPQPAGGVLPRRARRHARRAGAARIHARAGGRRPDGLLRRASHLAARDAPKPDAVFVCGPPALVEAVRDAVCRRASPRASSRPSSRCPTEASGGTVSFADSGVDVTDDGRSLLEQAEAAGLSAAERMPDGHLPHLHPPQDQRCGQEPDHRRRVDDRRARTCRSASPPPSATSPSRSNPIQPRRSPT